MKTKYLLIVIVALCFKHRVSAQVFTFYNVENLFDTIDDPYKNDDEFLPTGKKEWNTVKYKYKLKHIASVLRAIGDSIAPPAVIGLAEIENRTVLEDLIQQGEFRKHKYDIIHKESKDKRGIDVAILYDQKTFSLKGTRFINPPESIVSRDIVYAKLMDLDNNLYHIYVVHAPSRWGGKERSEPKRIGVFRKLRREIDNERKEGDKIIIMGDFNDDPTDKSVEKELIQKEGGVKLINLSNQYKKMPGTLKYASKWFLFDQICVSTSVIPKVADIFVIEREMLEKRRTISVRRNFRGPIWLNGYSDHLPVYLKI